MTICAFTRTLLMQAGTFHLHFEKSEIIFPKKICQFQKWYYLCNRNSGH